MKTWWRRRSSLADDKSAEKKRSAGIGAGTISNARLTYRDYMAKLLARHQPARAMELAVGGDYERMGDALLERLRRFGVQPNDYLVDVGCGSGRLAAAITRSPAGATMRYLGIDVVPEMLAFAASQCQQPRWRFEVVTQPQIPEADGAADMVCFFSLFTHLLEEESFLYLQEARRVLRPGGKIVASYLDIADPEHWPIFEANVQSARHRQEKPMDIFLSADFFVVWAEKLGLRLIEDRAPDCGQRTCVLEKP